MLALSSCFPKNSIREVCLLTNEIARSSILPVLFDFVASHYIAYSLLVPLSVLLIVTPSNFPRTSGWCGGQGQPPHTGWECRLIELREDYLAASVTGGSSRATPGLDPAEVVAECVPTGGRRSSVVGSGWINAGTVTVVIP